MAEELSETFPQQLLDAFPKKLSMKIPKQFSKEMPKKLWKHFQRNWPNPIENKNPKKYFKGTVEEISIEISTSTSS